MRVALFFDGKNFYSGWKDAGGVSLDFSKLAEWLVKRVGGNFLWGAYYYTGIESDSTAPASSQLTKFLDALELQTGFFVYRFPRKHRTGRCSSCGGENVYTQEKEVDTSMVADMLRLAAVDAFDVLVLMSGDADHSPAVEGVRAIGKQAYVATWGGIGLSTRLRRAAFDHVDLKEGLGVFRVEQRDVRVRPPLRSDASTEEPDQQGAIKDFEEGSDGVFLQELEAAELQFSKGYVGINYFTTRWESESLDASPIVRRRLLNRLVENGRVELYDAENGEKAMRRKS